MVKDKIKSLVRQLFSDSKFKYLLIAIVIISYVQILFMQPWQDDNALFFKVSHVNENAGYFGAGPIGEGAYKYSATLFILIYKLFGFNPLYYFGLALLMYIFASLVVYVVFSEILGETSGKLSSIIYAGGYIVSDGVWRLANSVTTSISVILALLTFLFYWRYYKNRQVKWYLFALIAFWGGLEFSMSRFHYFVVVVFAFELIFLAFEKGPKSLMGSLIRVIPFYYLFSTRILGGDARIGGVSEYIRTVASGNLAYTYGFISSVGNLFIPDWITTNLFGFQKWLSGRYTFDLPLASLIMYILSPIVIYLLVRKKPKKLPLFIFFSILLYFWFSLSGKIYATPLINPNDMAVFISQLGGLFIIFTFIILYTVVKIRKPVLFLFIWFLANIAAYSAVNPYLAFSSADRYLFHSFLPLVGIVSIFYSIFPKNRLGAVGKVTIILITIGNLFFNIRSQTSILSSRSQPTKKFYTDLKLLLPSIGKRDILYFDTGGSGRFKFNDAISAAMMPNSTSFAWRYGLDRYDFELFNDFGDLKGYLSDHSVKPGEIHTFFYDGKNIIDTSKEFVSLGSNNTNIPADFEFSTSKLVLSNFSTYFNLNNIESELILNTQLYSVVPPKVSVELSCRPIASDQINFPFSYREPLGKTNTDKDELNAAMLYNSEKLNVKNNYKVTTRSDWRERVSGNLIDGDTSTAWQADRVEWQEANEYITIENLRRSKIARIVFVNSYSSQSPTEYEVLSSDNFDNWKQIVKVSSLKRYKDGELIILKIPNDDSRFLRVRFTKTLNGDSPAFSEMWVLTNALDKLDIIKAENFINSPFSWVVSKEVYGDLINQFKNTVEIKLLWKNEKEVIWQSSNQATNDVRCDGLFRTYAFPTEAGGIRLSSLKLQSNKVPVSIDINRVFVDYSGFLKKN
ncbi:discoidin domain-containing protein [Candidatus Woesebacteria bacterium]|nr:discoidin domain-containing protein [Candidatus Woesebacteria bacterium]